MRTPGAKIAWKLWFKGQNFRRRLTMSKGIRSYPVSQQAKVVARRRHNHTGGLGWLAAMDAPRPSTLTLIKKEVSVDNNNLSNLGQEVLPQALPLFPL